MRDTRVKTHLGLAAVATVIASAMLMIGVLGGTLAASRTASPVTQGLNRPTSYLETASSPTTTTTSTTVQYPTTVQEQLSSVVVSSPLGLAKGVTSGTAEGNAYGIVKQAARTQKTMINDEITVTAIQGTIPGTVDTIQLKTFFDGSTTPYCTVSTTFDATGLTSYTTNLLCKYLGTGTYNFKVTVYDENGNVIGDPTTTMVL